MGAGVGAAASSNDGVMVTLKGIATSGLAAWAAAQSSSLQANSATDASAQIAALSASVRTLSMAFDSTLRARSGPSPSALLVMAPLVGALYYFRGAIGWVTLHQMQEALEGVRTTVVQTIEHAKAVLLDRIGVVEAQGEEIQLEMRKQTVEMGRLHQGLEAVHESVGKIERRLDDMEVDVTRSARGVELLVEFVQSANPPGSPAGTLPDRMQSFTGRALEGNCSHAAALATANPPLPATWSGRASPTSSFVSSVLSGRIAQ